MSVTAQVNSFIHITSAAVYIGFSFIHLLINQEQPPFLFNVVPVKDLLSVQHHPIRQLFFHGYYRGQMPLAIQTLFDLAFHISIFQHAKSRFSFQQPVVFSIASVPISGNITLHRRYPSYSIRALFA